MPKRQVDLTDVDNVVTPVSVSPGQFTSLTVDGAGAQRAKFVFHFGANTGTTAALSAGIGVWGAATSGGTFTQVAAAAAATSGVLTAGKTLVLDVPVTPSTRWMKISGGSVLNSAIVAGCTVTWYNTTERPPTDVSVSEIEVVTV